MTLISPLADALPRREVVISGLQTLGLLDERSLYHRVSEGQKNGGSVRAKGRTEITVEANQVLSQGPAGASGWLGAQRTPGRLINRG